MGYCYAFQCLIIFVFSEVGLCKLSLIPFLLTVILSVLFYLNLNIFIYGLAIGYAIKVLPVLYSGVIFNLVYNSFNFKQACDILDLVGSFTIVAVYVYKSVIEK